MAKSKVEEPLSPEEIREFRKIVKLLKKKTEVIEELRQSAENLKGVFSEILKESKGFWRDFEAFRKERKAGRGK